MLYIEGRESAAAAATALREELNNTISAPAARTTRSRESVVGVTCQRGQEKLCIVTKEAKLEKGRKEKKRKGKERSQGDEAFCVPSHLKHAKHAKRPKHLPIRVPSDSSPTPSSLSSGHSQHRHSRVANSVSGPCY